MATRAAASPQIRGASALRSPARASWMSSQQAGEFLAAQPPEQIARPRYDSVI
jgi:hypothetical protein